MIRKEDIELLKEASFDAIPFNCHDVMRHSNRTGHNWIIISYYEYDGCYILHRHSQRDSYHRQRGRYDNFEVAIKCINVVRGKEKKTTL